MASSLLIIKTPALASTSTPHHDIKCENAFNTFFYIGINVGIALAGISSGYIKEYLGWHASFAIANIGLILGILTFKFGLRSLVFTRTHSQVSHPTSISMILFLEGGLLAVFCINKILISASWINWLLASLSIIMLTFLTLFTQAQPFLS